MIQPAIRRRTGKVRPQSYRGLNRINIELLEPRRLLSAATSLVYPEVGFAPPVSSVPLQNGGHVLLRHVDGTDASPFSGIGFDSQQVTAGISAGLVRPSAPNLDDGETGWSTSLQAYQSGVDGGVLRPTPGLSSGPNVEDGTPQAGYPTWRDQWANEVIVGIDSSAWPGSLVIAAGEVRGLAQFGSPDGMAPPVSVILAAIWQEAIHELAGNTGTAVFSSGTIYDASAGRAAPRVDIAAPGIIFEQSETITFAQPADRALIPYAPGADIDRIHAAVEPVTNPSPLPAPAAPSVTPLAMTPTSTSTSAFLTNSAASPIPTVAAYGQTTGAIQSLFSNSRFSTSARWTSSLGIVADAASSAQAVAATTGAVEVAGGAVHVAGKIADGARQMLGIVADSPSLPAQVAYNFIHFDAAAFRDAIAMFANELATLPSSDVANPSSARAWEITAAVLSFDAAFLAYWYRKSRQERRARRGILAGTLQAFGPRLM